MPHGLIVALIVFAPPAAVVVGVIVIASRFRASERKILTGAAITFLSLCGVGVIAWLMSATYTDPPLVTVRNDAPWPVTVQIDNEDPVDLQRGESHSFTEPETPIPGYGIIDHLTITGGEGRAERVVIDGDTGDEYATITLRAAAVTP